MLPPQRGAEGPALQHRIYGSPRAVLAHLRARQEGQVHALRIGGPAFHPLSWPSGPSHLRGPLVDVFQPHLKAVLRAAAAHQGTAFVEILQNCNIFNDGAWESLTEKDHARHHTIAIEHGRPLVSARTRTRDPEERPRARGGGARQRVSEKRPHRPRRAEPESRLRLPSLAHGRGTPGFPTPLGVLARSTRRAYEEGMNEQIRA